MVIGCFGKTALTEKWNKASSAAPPTAPSTAPAPSAPVVPTAPRPPSQPQPQLPQMPRRIVGATKPVRNGAYNALSQLLNKKK